MNVVILAAVWRLAELNVAAIAGAWLYTEGGLRTAPRLLDSCMNERALVVAHASCAPQVPGATVLLADFFERKERFP